MRDRFGIFGTVARIRKLSLFLVMMLRIPNNYERDDRILPFKVNKDPSILLNNEDTPWLRDDHNQRSYIKKFILVPA